MAFDIPGVQDSGSAGRWVRVAKIKDRPNKQVRLRLLDSFISGFEGWDTTKKPHRKATLAELLQTMKDGGHELRVENDSKNPKQFWACPVANITDGVVGAVSFTQVTIMKAIKALVEDAEWGDPTAYDIVVAYTEDNGKVVYNVRPCKPTDLDPALAAEWAELKASWVGLEALYHGADPFDGWSK